ncbi:MAG: DUF4105 domain-containing protein [Rhodanobacteraceae bacterium]|nr:DUF4105 domain-containing protein [Rhodanobacteraceae bacterium]
MPAKLLQPRFLPLLAGLLLLLFTGGLRAQPATEAEPGSELQISLLTFGPGEIYWERFGHNAIAIRDTRSGDALSINYGIFDFEEEAFFLNFLRGDMRYSIAATSLEQDLAYYREQGRAVLEQELDLTPAQRLALRDFLLWNLRPENARYRYEYFTSNCSTKVRDALDRVLDGAIRRSLETRSRGYTYRLQADSLLAPIAGLMLPMDLGLGPYADRRLSFWDESFVPAEFARHLPLVQIPATDGSRKSLVRATRVLGEASPVLAAAERSFLRRHGPYPIGYAAPAVMIGGGFGLLLLLLARSTRPRAALAFAALASLSALSAGLAGLLLAALWLLTEHVSAWRNENLLLLNPLLLLLLPALWRTRRIPAHGSRSTRVLAGLILLLALFALAGKTLPWFTQQNAVWIGLLLPPHLVIAWRLLRGRAHDAVD